MGLLLFLSFTFGGISLTLRKATWNSLVRLANEVGEIHGDNDEVGNEASGDGSEIIDADNESIESDELLSPAQ